MEDLRGITQTQETEQEKITYAVDFFLSELRHPDTGRESRSAYIRSLNQLLKTHRYQINLVVAMRHDVEMLEKIGEPLSELVLVGIDDDTFTKRGLLVFSNSHQQMRSLPVIELPPTYEVKVSPPNIFQPQ